MSKTVMCENKLCILKEIRECKEVLFGSFSEKLTKKDKINSWKTIHEKTASLGLVGPDKDWTYSRDVFWQNLKKATMKKVDNRRKTGSAGGTDCKFNDTDNIILDIIGKESPIISSLNVPDTWEKENEPECSSMIQNIINNREENLSTNNYIDSSTTKTCSSVKNNKRKIREKDKSPTEGTVDDLKRKKMQLQIELLEKENYHKTLQILQLERELQITPSKFTQSLPPVTYFIVNNEINDLNKSMENE